MSLIKMQFDPNIAKDIDINSAIIFSNIQFWVDKNKANNKNLHDGRYWTYNSVDAFSELFIWITKKQMRTCLEKLEEKGYIKSGNYNQSSYDRTKWYTTLKKTVISTFDDNGGKTCPNGQKVLPITATGDAHKGEPIPDTKPDTKPYILKEDFSKFDFFEDWNELRFKHLGKPSFIKSMSNYDFSEFKRLKEGYSRDDFRGALVGLFKQKKMPNDISSMQTNPTHFLKCFNTYITAYHDRDIGVYGNKSNEI